MEEKGTMDTHAPTSAAKEPSGNGIMGLAVLATAGNEKRRPRRLWKEREEDLLRTAVGVAGETDHRRWTVVAKVMSSFGCERTGAECAQHWRRVMKKPNSMPWTPIEDARLIEAVREHGEHAWVSIAKDFDRCDVQCRYRWVAHLRKTVRLAPPSPPSPAAAARAAESVKELREQHQEMLRTIEEQRIMIEKLIASGAKVDADPVGAKDDV